MVIFFWNINKQGESDEWGLHNIRLSFDEGNSILVSVWLFKNVLYYVSGNRDY